MSISAIVVGDQKYCFSICDRRKQRAHFSRRQIKRNSSDFPVRQRHWTVKKPCWKAFTDGWRYESNDTWTKRRTLFLCKSKRSHWFPQVRVALVRSKEITEYGEMFATRTSVVGKSTKTERNYSRKQTCSGRNQTDERKEPNTGTEDPFSL